MRLGSCEILGEIGRGGMGEVYRGRDTKLGRDVAVKALPDAFAHDAERLARFEREAQVLASLNHPNIAIIYELKEVGPSKYLIMELVEGDTLAERIRRGSLPIEEALDVAQQIADALEAAHEKGVVHRDLKLANVMTTPEGRVKVLDFGLAKIHTPDDPEQDFSNSPTLSAMQTARGVILGTAAYMSPEQARGKKVDPRADVWAFGCVLYEMLTGRQAFPNGETISDTIAGILAREPDWQALPPGTPPKIRTLLESCLRKDERRRLRDIAYARIEIEEARSERARPLAAAPAGLRGPSRFAWALLPMAALLVLAVAVSVFLYFRAPQAQEEIGFLLTVPPMPNPFQVSVSPDGRRVAFVASASGGTTALFVRPVGSTTPTQIAGTEGALNGFWSPDSRYIAFAAAGTLKKVDVLGGSPQNLCTVGANFFGGSWNDDGVIIFASGAPPLLSRVSDAGGEPVAMTALDQSQQEAAHIWPYFLPDGRRFLYLSGFTTPGNNAIYVGSLDSKEKTKLLNAQSMPAYAAPGYLLFHRAGTLFAQPFDADDLALSGEPVRLADNVAYNVQTGRAAFAASQNGVLVYRTGEGGLSNVSQLAWFNRNGRQLGLAGPAGQYVNIGLSPDAKYVAFQRGAPDDIWILEIQRGVASRFTSNAAVDNFPVWSADGRTIAFRSNRDGQTNLYERAFGVVAEEKLVLKEAGNLNDWSRDGRHLIYDRLGDIWAVPLAGERKPFHVTETSFAEIGGRVSPDGRWIVYYSSESSPDNQPNQVYIQSFPQPGPKQLVSTNGGAQLRWGRDGKEFFYIATDLTLMAASIKPTGSSLEVGVPVPLFKAPVFSTIVGRRDYDVSADGRFLINVANTTATSTTPITVTLNWTTALAK
jgi:Tol biopolymer transport system component